MMMHPVPRWLNDAVSASIGFPGSVVSPVSFNDFVTSQNGAACQISYSETGATVAATSDWYGSATSTFQAQGWEEDINYGAGGPTGLATAFRKDATLCLLAYERKPVDRALCSQNEPISTCFDKLTPEQIVYSLVLTCSTYFP